jgi:hypothetical protein
MSLSTIFLALSAASLSCSGNSVARYIGHWSGVNKDAGYVDIKQTLDGIIVKQRNEGQTEVTLKSLVTVDGKLVVLIGGTYGVVLNIDDKTGELVGGEQSYRKSSK